MSSINAIADQPIGLREQIERAGWIHSAPFDGFLLIFAPLVTLPVIAAIYFRIPWLAIGGGVTLAFAHYFSTAAFFLWNENREYYRARWLAFAGGPVIITIIYGMLLGFHVPYVVQFVLFFWNTIHVSRQNCGILSIYRNKAGIKDPGMSQRHAANGAIISFSLFLAVWNIDTHKEVSPLFGIVSGNLNLYVKIATGAIAAICLLQLGRTLVRRREMLGLPETLFLASSSRFLLAVSVHPRLRGCDVCDAVASLCAVHVAGMAAASSQVRRRARRRAAAAAAHELKPHVPRSGAALHRPLGLSDEAIF